MSETLPTGEYDDGMKDAVESIKATHESSSPRGVELDPEPGSSESGSTESGSTEAASTTSSASSDEDGTTTTERSDV